MRGQAVGNEPTSGRCRKESRVRDSYWPEVFADWTCHSDDVGTLAHTREKRLDRARRAIKLIDSAVAAGGEDRRRPERDADAEARRIRTAGGEIRDPSERARRRIERH